MPSRVLLPEPDGPTMETKSPFIIWKLIPLRISIRSRPNGRLLVMSRTSITTRRSRHCVGLSNWSVLAPCTVVISSIDVPYSFSLIRSFVSVYTALARNRRKKRYLSKDVDASPSPDRQEQKSTLFLLYCTPLYLRSKRINVVY